MQSTSALFEYLSKHNQNTINDNNDYDNIQ